ncbi:MAG: hypothetical protein WC223_10180 [Bacteroidales bacterium]
MKINFKIILFFISLFFIQRTFSQDTILLLNGKQIQCKAAYVNETSVVYHKLHKNEKIKQINKEKVYSITDSLGKKKIIYDKDTTNGFYLTKEQMLIFIKGEQYAAKECKLFSSFVLSFAVGGLSAYVLKFYGVPMVALTPIVFGAIQTKSYESNPNKKLVNNEFFIEGYQTKARYKKIKSSLIGGIIGFTSVAIIIDFTTK